METYVVSIVSATIGAGVAIFTIFWRTRYTIRAQDFSKRVEELSALIKKLETLASERWSQLEKAISTTSRPMIIGSQAQICLSISYLNDEYSDFDSEKISEPVASFFEACSGGAFDELGMVEPQRVRTIMVEGERLRIELLKIRNRLY